MLDEPAAIRLRTATSIGFDFLDALEWLDNIAPDTVEAKDRKSVERIVEKMKGQAEMYGFVGNRIRPPQAEQRA